MSGDKRIAQAECLRFDELELKVANGTSWTTEEQEFVTRHEAGCEVCGALTGALEQIRHDGSKGAGSTADELTTRRVINGALDEAWRSGESTWAPELGDELTAPVKASPSRPRSALRMAGLSAVVAALTAMLVAALVVYSGDDEAALHFTAVVGAGTGENDAGVTAVLVAGAVTSRGGAVSLGQALAPGAELRVGTGRAAVRIGRDVTVLLSAHTTARLSTGRAGGRSLRLIAGELLVAVTPGQSPAPFVVRVADARVTVTGTIFSVKNNGQGAEVAVLRGSVRVTAVRRAPQRVTRSQRYGIGKRSAELMDAARTRSLWRRARVLDLLRADRPARLSLRTDPAGAVVRVDGTLLGTTPLDAAIGEGQRELQLQLADHTPVRERILLRSTATYERDFQLSRMRPRPVGSGGGRSVTDTGGGDADEGWRALVKTARAQRAARDWRGAARAYSQLIRRYPRQGAARTALVSLGFIQLEHLGQPAAARASFERYLAGSRGGALAPEANWGLIRALAALGSSKAEVSALKRFLKRYPRSVYRRRAGKRLQKLTPDSRRRRTK